MFTRTATIAHARALGFLVIGEGIAAIPKASRWSLFAGCIRNPRLRLTTPLRFCSLAEVCNAPWEVPRHAVV